MTSHKQTEANRRNAQKSTGPNTPEGKEASKMNALKHGLLANDILLPDESQEVFDALRDQLYEEGRPEGFLEIQLVDQIIIALWRKIRACRVEAGIYTRFKSQEDVKNGVSAKNEYQEMYDLVTPSGDDAGNVVGDKGEPELTEEQRYYADLRDKALESIDQASDLGASGVALLGATFLERADLLAKLSRYETTLENSLYRAINELKRLQEARRKDENTEGQILDLTPVRGTPETN